MAKGDEKQYPPLQRSETNKIIAGVAGGLGEYFGLDPMIFRIIFVLLTIFGGSGILIYIVLWLILPSGPEIVNPKSQIKDNFEDMKTKAKSFASDFRWKGSQGGHKPLLGFILLILGALFLLDNFGFYSFSIGKLWPVILIIVGLSIITR